MASGRNEIMGFPTLTGSNTMWVGICDGSARGEIMEFPTQMGSDTRQMGFRAGCY